jgi:CheY-like chemotaxis protein
MQKRILLIDDDKDDAELFVDALQETGTDAAFNHYNDGIEALARLAEPDFRRPDVIFLDINMPAVDGWECLRRIKQVALLKNIPIVMYSTSNLLEKGVSPSDVGAAAFLTKPDSFNELKRKLSELLGTLFQ